MTSLFYILIYFNLFEKNFIFVKIFESGTFFIFLFSYLYTALINPGIPNKQHFSKNYKFTNKEEVKKYQICKECNIIFPKTYKVFHCSVCNVCIREYDHHCPWTGKCIGKNNLRTFYVFVTFLIIYILATFTTVVMYGFAIDLHKKK